MNHLFRVSLVLFVLQIVVQSNVKAQTLSSSSEVRTEIIIEGTPDQIWKLLINFSEYQNWHPYFCEVSGSVEKGKYLNFKTKQLDGSPDGKFRAKLLEIEPMKDLSWGGNAWFFFKAKHYFHLIKVDDKHTKLIQGEYWRGLFGKSYGKKYYPGLLEKFERLNETIKIIVESK